jgi:hypothetical protein
VLCSTIDLTRCQANWILDLKSAEPVSYPPGASVNAQVGDGFYQVGPDCAAGRQHNPGLPAAAARH